VSRDERRVDPATLARLAAGRDDGDAARTLAPDSVAALVESGLLRLGVPEALGGPGWRLGEVLDALEALSEVDVSAAWIVWNNLLPALFGQRLDPAARAEAFADPSAVYGNSTRAQGRAVPSAGGYRVSGRWGLVSGAMAATRFALLCNVDAERAAPRLVFIDAADVTVLDTWHTQGLRGTGSHDVVVDDVAVPDERTCPFAGPSPSRAGGLDLLAPIGVLAVGCATMLVTLARLGVDELVGIARANVPTDGRPQAAARGAVAQGVARAGADVRSARAAVRRAADDLEAAAEPGSAAEQGWDAAAQSGAERMAAVFESVDVARRAAQSALASCVELGGTAAIRAELPLDRAHRDAHVMARHVMFDPLWLEEAGRVRLGFEPANPLFAET